MRDRLKQLGLDIVRRWRPAARASTSCVPLTPHDGWDDVKAFAEAMARTMAADEPDRYLAEMSKARAQGPHLHRLSAQRPRRDGDRALLDAGAEGRAGRLAGGVGGAGEARERARGDGRERRRRS